MPPLALGLVVIAAVLHATWNILLKTSGDPLRTAVRLQALGSVVLVPLAVIAWWLNDRPPLTPAGVAVALVSAVIEAAYFLLLTSAYRRGGLSLVYPIARGSAPLIAVAVAVLLLGERLAPIAWVGVGCLLAGILAVGRPWRALRRAGAGEWGAIGFALATGAAIAAYSAVDRVGVRLLEPWLYGAVLAISTTVLLAIAVRVGRDRGWLHPAPGSATATAADAAPAGIGPTDHPGDGLGRRSPRRDLARDLVAGVLSLGAYYLVLVALSIAPLAAVAPVRESSVVVGAAWGAIRLGEAIGRRETATRLAAAGLVLAGVLLLAVGQG